MKPVYVKTKIRIRVPVAKVAAFAAQPDNVPQWYVNIKTVEWKTARPLQIGSQIFFNAQFLGRQMSYVYEIVEWVPHQKMVMKTSDGPFPMTTTYLWEDIHEHTIMTLINEGYPTGFSKLMGPFISMAMKSANNKDLKRLKKILEENT